MHAVILAGGKGTRLRPYTAVIPKPLVPIGEHTYILDVILRQLAAYGFETITLAIGTHGHLIRCFAGDGSQWGLEINYAEESSPLGTIGPLLTVLDHLPEHFLVMNGDVLTNLNYAAVLEQHVAAGAPLTVATCTRQSAIDFGVVTVQDGYIAEFQEKPVITHDVSMGVYALSRSTLESFEAGLPLGFDTLVLDLLARHNRPATYHWDGYWLDIGQPEDYERANSEFARFRPKLLPQAQHRPIGATTTTSGPILVFGGLGFLGRHVVDSLASLVDSDVIVSGRRLLSHHREAKVIEFDLVQADPSDIAELLRATKPAAVINCTGATTGPGSRLHVANVVIPTNLVEAVAQSGTNARLVHLGSAAEYGPGRDGTPLSESAPLRPASLYGTTKLAGSTVVLDAIKAGRVDGTVLRIFNPVGPGAPSTSLAGHLVDEIRKASRTNAPVRIGSLGGRRDFVDVRDAADAVAKAAAAEHPFSGVVNIARGEATPVKDLVGELLRIAGYDGSVRVDDVLLDRSAAVDWQCADISLAATELRWRPRRSLSQALRDLWEGKLAERNSAVR